MGLNKREARELVDCSSRRSAAALSSGEQVKISGFGTSICETKTGGPPQPQSRRRDPHQRAARRTFRPGPEMKARVEAYAGTKQ